MLERKGVCFVEINCDEDKPISERTTNCDGGLAPVLRKKHIILSNFSYLECCNVYEFAPSPR